MTVKELARRLGKADAPRIVDVRSGFEFRSGHIPGAVHAPALTILFYRKRLPQQRSAPLLLTCEHGPRAVLARGLLRLAGFSNIELLDGHMSAWRRAGGKMEYDKS